MAIALLVGRDYEDKQHYDWFIKDWQQSLLAMQPDLDLRVWPELGHVEEIDYALVWRHPFGVLKQFPNLKGIASLAAGVDHVMVDPGLIKHVPITRVVDPFMANDIVQYITAYVLQYVKRTAHWSLMQEQKVWNKEPPFSFADQPIGVMGLGFLGSKAVHVLKQLGLTVLGWSQSLKHMDDVKTYAGKEGFIHFLSQTQILICMLPLTHATRHILNKDTFSCLRKGAYLMNVGRGEHLVEEDLIEALKSGQLSGACLDVFKQEPLPQDHPFWAHPVIRVTPHIASVTNAATAVSQILENYHRALAGLELLNLVDIEKGY